MEYKWSYYNMIISLKNKKRFVYNTITGSMLNYEIPFLQLNYKELAPEILDKFIKMGLLVDKKTAEFDSLINKTIRSQNKKWAKDEVTIIPTWACNFSCSYCFQKHYDISITPKLENRLIEYLCSKLFSEKLKIIWWGGEPLLKPNSIQRIYTLLQEKGVSVDSEVITNGYLLDSVHHLIPQINLKRIQITIDGSRQQHDKRRGLLNGGGSYDKIMQNIKKTAKEFDKIKINIRVNLDNDNLDQFDTIYATLDEQLTNYENITIFPAIVQNYSDTFCRANMDNWTFSNEFITKYVNIIFNPYFKKIKISSPLLFRLSYCGYDFNAHPTIDPLGNVYRCWAEANCGADKRIGNINVIESLPVTEPVFNKKCRYCKIFPLCRGGCKPISGEKSFCRIQYSIFQRNIKKFYYKKNNEYNN